eukprot:1004802-Amphidinium_carterae.1
MGVKQAVHSAVELKLLEPLVFLGQQDYTVQDGRTIAGPEGMICGVLPSQTQKVWDTTRKIIFANA